MVGRYAHPASCAGWASRIWQTRRGIKSKEHACFQRLCSVQRVGLLASFPPRGPKSHRVEGNEASIPTIRCESVIVAGARGSSALPQILQLRIESSKFPSNRHTRRWEHSVLAHRKKEHRSIGLRGYITRNHLLMLFCSYLAVGKVKAMTAVAVVRRNAQTQSHYASKLSP
jgi:hypothetical protein